MIRSTRQGSPCVNAARAGERGTGRGCLGRCNSSSSSVAFPVRAARLSETLGINGAVGEGASGGWLAVSAAGFDLRLLTGGSSGPEIVALLNEAYGYSMARLVGRQGNEK